MNTEENTTVTIDVATARSFSSTASEKPLLINPSLSICDYYDEITARIEQIEELAKDALWNGEDYGVKGSILFWKVEETTALLSHFLSKALEFECKAKKEEAGIN